MTIDGSAERKIELAVGSNAPIVAELAKNVEIPEKIGVLDNFYKGWDEVIKKGGVVFDVGCNSGEVGVVLAARHNCSLIQADTATEIISRVGKDQVPYVKLESDKVPVFDENGTKADTILLVDVLHHVGYGNGWNQEERKINPDGKASDLLAFLRGLSTSLTEDGKILVVTTHPDPGANFVKSDFFKENAKSDPIVGSRLVFVD